MTIYVDIDETICSTSGTDYEGAEPLPDRIKKINQLFEEGHTIVYWTSRGVVTGIDWEDSTKAQLWKWGAKYHELRLDKPFFDLFIDDKSVNSKEYFKKHE